MFTDSIFVRNERLAREFGAGWAEDLMARCEEEARQDCPRPMDAVPSGECPAGAHSRAAPPDFPEGLEVFWCDSDPAVAESGGILQREGLKVSFFNEPEAVLEAYRARPHAVVGVLSSMMEGNGRKERGAMNALGLFSACTATARALGIQCPVLIVISLTADRDAAVAAGADTVVYGNRVRAQNLLLARLRDRLRSTRVQQ
mmetsp:Transcript_104891/g.327105  ORF Transcript_104891/g.327105 Transcript_104891/m.327105 type:complete len:201 (+) Transcript_104891:792-1394(+)